MFVKRTPKQASQENPKTGESREPQKQTSQENPKTGESREPQNRRVKRTPKQASRNNWTFLHVDMSAQTP